jgi:hypothetical protein
MKAIWIGPLVALLAVAAPAAETPTQTSEPAAEGHIAVENRRAEKSVMLSSAEIAKLPRAEVVAGKTHRKYSGVPLADLLQCAGVEWGGKCSPLLTCYVLVEGADGYRALFSIPEVDPEQRHAMVILADRCDGKPLSAIDGPYQMIEEDARQHGRWVRHVQTISLQAAVRPRSRPN